MFRYKVFSTHELGKNVQDRREAIRRRIWMEQRAKKLPVKLLILLKYIIYNECNEKNDEVVNTTCTLRNTYALACVDRQLLVI
jgi:hypothetical protein